MEKKLGLSALTALVLSSMLGAGVFSLPQNMAAVASPAALLIGWGITGAGILLLAFAMLLLTRIRPDLDGGIFTYAREGFGELIGFCSAWGYWLCAVIANVSYLVIVSRRSVSLPIRLNCVSSVMVIPGSPLWVPRYCCGSFTGWFCAASRRPPASTWWQHWPNWFRSACLSCWRLLRSVWMFKLDFTGIALGVPVWEQVKNTMLITLWVFIGVEGAVVVSARAQQARCGRATLLAYWRAGRLSAGDAAVAGRGCAS
jgi:arginine:ornithine antiporter/lysine permease